MGRGNRIAPRFADEKVEEGRLAYSDIVAPHAQPGKVVTQSFDFPIETLLLRRALLLDIDQIRFDVMESKRGTGSFRVGMPRPRMRSRRGMLLEPKIASFPRRRLPGRTRRVVVSSRTCGGDAGQVQDQEPALVVAATAGIRFQPARFLLYVSVTKFCILFK
jgi:hypothetical protein